MRRRFSLTVVVAALALAFAAPARAQEFRGRINGVVTDASGAVLPGVTVTATSPALIQPQIVVTGEDGAYRLIALPAGVYELSFELAGFKTFKRIDIRVVIGQTLPVDVKMEVATLEETVTVTGESPIVDTSTQRIGTNFTKELLTEIPNARDVWAAMAQAPGFTMQGYDVGGSHAGTQTGYVTYGITDQNTTRIEGINTTESTNANAGYFDFGSFEEFQLGGAGNMADQDTAGASLNITVKSGGDRFSGLWYSDWEGDATVANNVPDELKVGGGVTDDGFKAPATGVSRGNQIETQYDLNGSVGGPVYRGKAWFFFSWRLNNQYKFITGVDDKAQSRLENYTIKGTYQLTRSNQLIGYWNRREKLQPLRDFGLDTPISASRYQSSQNFPFKGEWTSVLTDRMFLDVIVADWRNYFPLRPTYEGGLFPEDSLVPGRIDLNSNQRYDGGPHDTYQKQRRYKPQFAASLAYFKDGWRGTHDFKFGTEGRWEKRLFLRDQPYNIFYRDRGTAVSELELYNSPVDGDNRTTAFAFYAQDTWKLTDNFTINLGARVDSYKDWYPDQSIAPTGVAGLENATDPRLVEFFRTKDVEGATVSESTTFAPRAGFAWDVFGNNKSVLKGFFGQYYFNSAPDTLAALQNPVGSARLRYRFSDLNGNRLLDGPSELGAFLSTQGGAGFVKIDPDIERPSSREISAHFEQELITGLSMRVSWVYKNIRNEWAEVDFGRVDQFTLQRTLIDPGPDGVTGTGDDQPVQLLDLPVPAAQVPQNRVQTNPDDPAYDSDYNTFEIALNRRFRNGWMLLTSFGHTWMDQFTSMAEDTTNALEAARQFKAYNWNPNQQPFGKEKQTIWNYKLIGRYVFPWEIGFSGSYKLQSGNNWGRYVVFNLPNSGNTNVRVEPVDTNRAPNVGIFDIRFDKSFRLGKFGRLTGMLDVFNLTNSAVVTNFRMVTGARFKEVIAILDPRIIRLGVRYDF